MSNFVIEIFAKIIGVGAASGICFHANDIKIVSDNSNYLYSYNLSSSSLQKTLIYDNGVNNEIVEKKNKLDIESIFYYDDSFYMFGSASSSLQNRENLFVYNPKTDQVTTTNLSAQFQSIREKINIDNTDFNIEGSFIYKGNYYLLNRGNGKNGRNGIIITDTDFENVPKFVNISLPVDNQYASFTDGIVVENSIYFLAAIEETTSTYDDGAIGGSFFGKINLKTLKLEKFEKISNTNKFEGLAFYKKDKKTTQFLLCEDPDNNSQESTIYKLTINK